MINTHLQKNKRFIIIRVTTLQTAGVQMLSALVEFCKHQAMQSDDGISKALTCSKYLLTVAAMSDSINVSGSRIRCTNKVTTESLRKQTLKSCTLQEHHQLVLQITCCVTL